MTQDMPPAPPEAEVIKLARLAAQMTPAQAAEKVRASGGKISDTYWRDIERGHGGRRGHRVTARASEGVLAQMAHAVAVTPEQLIEAGRRDAATVLAEMLRRERNAPAARPALVPVPVQASADQFRPTPGVVAFAREYGVDPDNPEDPFLLPVRQEIADATVRYGMTATGTQVFYGHPWSASEARVWDNPEIIRPDKELLIAATRADRARTEAARHNRSSGRAGLTLATLARR